MRNYLSHLWGDHLSCKNHHASDAKYIMIKKPIFSDATGCENKRMAMPTLSTLSATFEKA
jgi:hypothetical protein